MLWIAAPYPECVLPMSFCCPGLLPLGSAVASASVFGLALMDFMNVLRVSHRGHFRPVTSNFEASPCLPIRLKGDLQMIDLTRLNGTPIILNSDLIKTAEESPDTMITLINGEKLIVRESCAELTERVLAYRSRLLAEVAQRMQRGVGIEQAASLTSLDLADLPSREGGPANDKDSRG